MKSAQKRRGFSHSISFHEPRNSIIVRKDGLLVGFLADVNFPWHPCGFRSRSNIDGVAKEAVARHPMANHPRHDLSGVDSYCHALSKRKNLW